MVMTNALPTELWPITHDDRAVIYSMDGNDGVDIGERRESQIDAIARTLARHDGCTINPDTAQSRQWVARMGGNGAYAQWPASCWRPRAVEILTAIEAMPKFERGNQ